MRILHITGEFPPYFIGGLGTYVYELSKRLGRNGYKIDVLVIKGDDWAYKQNTFSLPDNVSVIVKKFNSDIFSKFEEGIFSIRDIEEALDVQTTVSSPPDVVHVHDWYGVLWASVIKYYQDTPVVMTAHLPLRSGFTYAGHPIPSRIKMRLEALGFRIADIVTAPSKFVARILMSEYNVPAKKIAIIPNGVDTQYFSPSQTRSSKKEKIVLSVSRMTEQKGIRYLLESAQYVIDKVPNTRFMIVGDGPLLNTLKNMSHSLGISDNVKFPGFVSREELLELYKSSDIFVSTSIYEPFGLVILEAMASGKPIIAFSTGGIEEIVRPNIDGLLAPPARVDVLGHNIVKVLLNPDLKIKFGKNARQRAIEYDWWNITSRIEHIYKNLRVRP